MTWNSGELSRRIVSGLPVIHSQSLAKSSDKPRFPGTNPANFLDARFWITSELPTNRGLYSMARIEASRPK
jgi:hypothetical protein